MKTPSRGTSTWECPACALLNRTDTDVCEVCEEPRPRGEEFGTPRSDGVGGGGDEFGTPRSDAGQPSTQEFSTPRNEGKDSSAGEQSDNGNASDSDGSLGDPDTARSFSSAKGDPSFSKATKGLSNLDIGGSSRGGRGAPPSARSGQGDFSTPREFNEEEVREAFNAFDSDGDGFLSVADVKLFFEALGENPSEAEVVKLVQQVDTNGRGAVSFDEFFEMATNSQFIRG